MGGIDDGFTLDPDLLLLDDLNVSKISEKSTKPKEKLPKGDNNPKKPQWPWAIVAIFLIMLGWNFIQRSQARTEKSFIGRLVDTITAQPIPVANDTESLNTVGAKSLAGAQGPKGDKGDSGSVGPQGPAGRDGSDGANGAQGPRGEQGASGATGLTGSTGPQGIQGLTGAAGPQGPQGPSGTASCPNGNCVSLQSSTPGTAETGHISISGTVLASSFSGSGASLTDLNASNLSSGTVGDARLSSSVTLQGNTFNGASQLVQTTAVGALPALSGANLTSLNASNISSGTLADGRLSGNVTLQGNAFNGASQLVRTTVGGALPALSGASLTSLNGSNISSGTVADARLSSNVTLQGNTFNGASQLIQLNASTQLPAVSGANLTNLNASNLASGTVTDARLSANVPLINAVNNFSAANTFSAAGTALSVTNNATIGGTLTVTTSLTIGGSGTALTQVRVYTPTLNPSSISASSIAEQTYTVTGLSTSDTVYINKPSLTSDCGIVNVRVSAADTLAITWININGLLSCDPASEVYRVVAIRS